jgi:tRNA G18 (ribose-2'-O)-methylase SpoU
MMEEPVGRYQWVTEMEDNQEAGRYSSLGIRNSDRHIEVQEFLEKPRLPAAALLDNIRSAYNVGSIFRTSDSTRLRKLFLCGMTAYPPNDKLEKTSLRSTPYVPWEHHSDPLEALKALKSQGYYIASLETTDASTDYMEFTFPENVCLVLGHEVQGVSREILKESDIIVEVPVWGMKNSLNVASIFSIVIYEIVRQYRTRGLLNGELFSSPCQHEH